MSSSRNHPWIIDWSNIKIYSLHFHNTTGKLVCIPIQELKKLRSEKVKWQVHSLQLVRIEVRTRKKIAYTSSIPYEVSELSFQRLSFEGRRQRGKRRGLRISSRETHAVRRLKRVRTEEWELRKAGENFCRKQGSGSFPEVEREVKNHKVKRKALKLENKRVLHLFNKYLWNQVHRSGTA